MSGLISSLFTNTQALHNHSASIATTGKNLARVDDPNFSRQRLQQVAVPAYSGAGLQRTQVVQIRDTVIDNTILRENATTGSLDVRSDLLDRMEKLFGNDLAAQFGASLEFATADGTSLGAIVGEFFTSWENLSARPNDSAARQQVLQSGELLTSAVNSLATQLDTLRSDAGARFTEETDRANTLLTQVADLNASIVRAEANGRSQAVDLRDTRQQILEELSTYANFTFTNNNDGSTDISLDDTAGDPVDLINGSTLLTTLTADAATFSLTANGNPLDLSSGRLGGLQTFANQTVTETQTSLDALAGDLVNSVNAAYATGFDPAAGVQPTFFDPANLSAATLSLDPALTSATLRTSANGASGDNGTARAIAELDSLNAFSEQANALSREVASEASANQESLLFQQSFASLLNEQRASISGVNLNEEMTQLLRTQRAFQASARVISQVDQMLADVVQQLGR